MDVSDHSENSVQDPYRKSRFAYRCGLLIFGLVWIFLSSTLCGCGAMNGYVMNRSGKRYYDKGNYEYARYEFERALMDDPHNANYAFNVARTMELEGEYENAEMMYQHALTIDPSHLPSYHSLASMLREQGRTAEAHELLVAWADTQPYNYDAQQSAANYYQQQGDLASAQRYSAQAMRNLPGRGTRLTRRQRMLHASATQQRAAYGPPTMQMAQQSYLGQPAYGQMVQDGNYSPRFPYHTPPSLQMAGTMPQTDPTMMGGPVVPPRTMASMTTSPAGIQQFPSQPVYTPSSVPTPQQYMPQTVPGTEPQLLPELPAPTSSTGPQAMYPEQYVSHGTSQAPVMTHAGEVITGYPQQQPTATFEMPATPQLTPPPVQGQVAPTLPQQPIQNVSANQAVPAVQAF